MMVEGEDFQDTPLGGFAGEALPPAPPQPKPKPQQGLVIEPPPWHGQDGKLDLGKPAENRSPDTRDVTRCEASARRYSLAPRNSTRPDERKRRCRMSS